MFLKYLEFDISERATANEDMQVLNKYLNVAIINLDVFRVKALKFDEEEIFEASRDRDIFQVT